MTLRSDAAANASSTSEPGPTGRVDHVHLQRVERILRVLGHHMVLQPLPEPDTGDIALADWFLSRSVEERIDAWEDVLPSLFGVGGCMLGLELRNEIAGLRTDIADGQRRLAFTLICAMVSISGITFAANALF